MRRREFIGFLGGTAAWPLAAAAQQPSLPVVGFLHPALSSNTSDTIAAFRQGLAQSGYVEGQNVLIEYRTAEGQRDKLPSLAADLVNRGVAVILANAVDAVRAARAATQTIPIVFVGANDPVQLGLAENLSRPGGNVTGVSYLAAELGQKRLELLRDMVPSATIVGVLVHRRGAIAREQVVGNAKSVEEAGRGLGLRMQLLGVESRSDLERAFLSLVDGGGSALVVLSDPAFTDWRAQIITLAANYAVPTIYPLREYAAVGGLMSYGASRTEAFRQAGAYVARILNGARPADLPILQPTKFELAINLKTANALNLTIPPTLLARADEVIE